MAIGTGLVDHVRTRDQHLARAAHRRDELVDGTDLGRSLQQAVLTGKADERQRAIPQTRLLLEERVNEDRRIPLLKFEHSDLRSRHREGRPEQHLEVTTSLGILEHGEEKDHER